jgi:hypothetical protein
MLCVVGRRLATRMWQRPEARRRVGVTPGRERPLTRRRRARAGARTARPGAARPDEEYIQCRSPAIAGWTGRVERRENRAHGAHRSDARFKAGTGTDRTRRCVVTPGRAKSPVLADPFYYLNNFKTVLSSLEERYRDLLSAEELQFIAQFAELPRPSCALLVRMIMRKGAFFRLSRLRYPEIGNAAEAAGPLVGVGWLQEPALDVSQLHRLLRKDELISYLRLPRPLCRLNKSAPLDVIAAQYPESRSFQAWCGNSQDRVFHPLVKPLAERFRLMFFGNFHQDWTEFVLADLGIFNYEAIPLQSAPFRTREHFEAFPSSCICVSGAWRRVRRSIKSLRRFRRR